MIPLRRRFPLALGLLAAGTVLAAAPGARSEDYGRVLRVAERCDVYGPNFVDLGNGVCGQVLNSSRIRVDAWPQPGTSNAALRSGGLDDGRSDLGRSDAGRSGAGLGDAGVGMVRGAAGAQHLRIGADPLPR